ncbi:oxidized purine nucleoside triphosphate hydrolase-like [Helicoverpa zea]|uniref:oxidized purine nucleoside triphosphate hydrolase-like n=1 Tax=Helicoverpa zea TaxID=7113 RepID=UPI001F581A40|nr:oxidized purine nucleoside triphosphate hydrolase-like [Helicoverpa zea]
MLVKKLFTLVFIRREDQILLGLKKRGFGMNKWNGFGGKVEPNETILEAAARELKEECCLTVKPSDLKNIAHLEFTFEGEPILMDVRVFSTSIFEGTPKETEEMRPKWFRHEDVPFDDMWLDDKLWFPYMLQGKKFFGHFHYEGFDKILNYKIEELDSMKAFYENRKTK